MQKIEYPPLTSYRVWLEDGEFYETNMASGITLKDARKYFVGNYLNYGGRWPEDRMILCIGVEPLEPL
jgi:hypothetical protein